jgi:ankyrin repeat protein
VNRCTNSFRVRQALEKPPTIRDLLEWGTDINAKDISALRAALADFEDASALLLLGKNADTNPEDVWALRVVSKGDEYVTYSTVNVDLRIASERGCDKMVRQLLEKGADPNASNTSTASTLQLAMSRGYAKLVRLLFKGSSRATALESTSLESYSIVAQLLVDKGADTNTPGGMWYNTLRTGGWSVQIVQQILESNAFLSADHLLSAMFDTDPQAEAIVAVMLPHVTLGCVAQEKDRPRMNLLHYAAICGSDTVTQRCLELGVDVHTRDDYGRTALHYAAECGHLTIVKMLVEGGSSINAYDYSRCTPILCAQNEASHTSIPWHMEGRKKRTPRDDVVEYLSDPTNDKAAQPRASQTLAIGRKRALDGMQK